MKSWSIILAAAIILFLTSAIQHPDRFEQGASAPEFRFENPDDTIASAQLKDRYILLGFWSPQEPMSRINNKLYAEAAKHIPESKLIYVGVNESSDTVLAKQILKVDNLAQSHQFSVSEEKIGSVRHTLRPYNSNQAYLINPEGKIIAVNPSPASLSRFQQAPRRKGS